MDLSHPIVFWAAIIFAGLLALELIIRLLAVLFERLDRGVVISHITREDKPFDSLRLAAERLDPQLAELEFEPRTVTYARSGIPMVTQAHTWWAIPDSPYYAALEDRDAVVWRNDRKARLHMSFQTFMQDGWVLVTCSRSEIVDATLVPGVLFEAIDRPPHELWKYHLESLNWVMAEYGMQLSSTDVDLAKMYTDIREDARAIYPRGLWALLRHILRTRRLRGVTIREQVDRGFITIDPNVRLSRYW